MATQVLTTKARTIKTIPCTITLSSGSAYDLTNCTVIFSVKESIDLESDELIRKEISEFTDPETGTFEIELDETDLDLTPGLYYFEVILINSLSKPVNMGDGVLVVKDRMSQDS